MQQELNLDTLSCGGSCSYLLAVRRLGYSLSVELPDGDWGVGETLYVSDNIEIALSNILAQGRNAVKAAVVVKISNIAKQI